MRLGRTDEMNSFKEVGLPLRILPDNQIDTVRKLDFAVDVIPKIPQHKAI